MVCEGQTLINKQGTQSERKEQALPGNSSGADHGKNGLPSRLRVPRGDSELLVVPPVCAVSDAVANNRELFKRFELLATRRKEARREALEIARRYTASVFPEQETDSLLKREADSPLFLTGHQPELFHPGVWVKNVLVDELAKRNSGISLNVIIDSDAVKSHSIKIPVKQNGKFVHKRIVIDYWPPGIPWEELRVVENELFESFADRMVSEQGNQLINKSAKIFWENVVSCVKKSGSVVDGLVAGRVQFERSLGIDNYEVPISWLANSASYRDFLAELMLHADQLQNIYNNTLKMYRQEHHIKSVMQPVPDLLAQNGWIELPVWVWNSETKHRRSLFVKAETKAILLSDRAGWEICIERVNNAEPAAADCLQHVSAQLLQLQNEGIRFRTKALMTTAYLRLFVADWFIHGIGGAKYDEITDSIITNFWNIPAPQFQIATGTLWLPIDDRPCVPIKSSAQLKQQLRYVKENPDQLLSETDSETINELLELKKKLVQQNEPEPFVKLSSEERSARHKISVERYRQYKKIRETLLELEPVKNKLRELEEEIELTRRIENDLKVVNGREYPICCYPKKTLQHFEEKIRDLFCHTEL